MTSWTKAEIATIAAAVLRAPSVHNIQPWELEFRDGTVSLFERLDLSLPWHDPTGRDRMISCGAALTNLELAVRILGHGTESLLFPDLDRPDEVARVVATGRRDPSDVDKALHSAIPSRHSHRLPFTTEPVPESVRHELTVAATAGGVQVRPIAGLEESMVLATLLGHTGMVLRQDQSYQRELLAWTNIRQNHRPGAGLPGAAPGYDTLPWAGLVRTTTSLPDATVLAARLRRECVLLVETPDDGPRDHVLAGEALQRVWLTATHLDLAGSVLTQPLRVAEVRAGLIERLDLAGFPQVLLRVGQPVGTAPHSPRIPVSELVRPGDDRKESSP